jgi:hypothetical protein
MAIAARDYLAIPAPEVAVKMLFNAVKDILGIQRHSKKAGTIRILMLIDDRYSV